MIFLPSVSLLPLFFLSVVFFTLLIALLFRLRARPARTAHTTNEQELLQKLQEREKAFQATHELNDIVLQTLDFALVVKRIANAIPQVLGYETGVLALVDETKGVLKRVAISDTSGGIAALAALEIPFSTIEIGLNEKENYSIKSLTEHRPLSTTNLYDVLRPAISQENCKIVQGKMHTKTTLVFPIYSTQQQPLGTLLVSMSKAEAQISEYERQTIENFVDGIRIALANASLYTSLGKTTVELKTANQKLLELDHLKDEFLTYAAHELRTPLTAVRGYANLLLGQKSMSGPLTPKQEEYLNRIETSSQRVIRLVNNLLDVSRMQAGRYEITSKPTDLLQLIQEALSEVLPLAQEQKQTLTITPQPSPLPQVQADRDKIKEVIINILGNAVKFTPEGGSITVSFAIQGNLVITTIKDTGHGVKPEDMQYLFQEYGMVKKNYMQRQEHQGTGLGLYISRAIVRLHGGDMTLTSEGENKGTSVSFSLKIADPPAA